MVAVVAADETEISSTKTCSSTRPFGVAILSTSGFDRSHAQYTLGPSRVENRTSRDKYHLPFPRRQICVAAPKSPRKSSPSSPEPERLFFSKTAASGSATHTASRSESHDHAKLVTSTPAPRAGKRNEPRRKPLRSKNTISASVAGNGGGRFLSFFSVFFASRRETLASSSSASEAEVESTSESSRARWGAHATATSAPRGCHASGGAWGSVSFSVFPEELSNVSPDGQFPRGSPALILAGRSDSPVAWNVRSSLSHTRSCGSPPRTATSDARNCPSPRHESDATPSPPPPPTGASAKTRNSLVMRMSVPAHVASTRSSPSGFQRMARRPCATRPTHSGAMSFVKIAPGAIPSSSSSGSGATKSNSPVAHATQTPRKSSTNAAPTMGDASRKAGWYAETSDASGPSSGPSPTRARGGSFGFEGASDASSVRGDARWFRSSSFSSPSTPALASFPTASSATSRVSNASVADGTDSTRHISRHSSASSPSRALSRTPYRLHASVTA